MRAALYWAFETGEHELAARTVSAVFWYWDTRGLLEEGQSWIAQQRGAALQQLPLDAAALFGAGTCQAEHVRLAFVRGALALAHGQIESVPAQSNPEAFERALQYGRSLALDEAVALAQSILEAADARPKQFANGRLR